MSVPEGCRNAITGIVDAITEAEATINAYLETLSEPSKTASKS